MFSAMVVQQDLNSCSVNNKVEAIRKKGIYFPFLATGLQMHFIFSLTS